MDGVPRWRIGIDVRSPDVGAAVAFDQIVDVDDQPPLAVPGLVVVLSTWLWQEGLDTRWWLGAIVEARSATSAAERVASVVDARTRAAGVRTRTVTIHATASTARSTEEIVAEEEVGLPRRSRTSPWRSPSRWSSACSSTNHRSPARTRAATR
jgi:hypothetical protein